MTLFRLIRRCDGLTYRFFPDATRPRVFRREDRPDLTIIWDASKGWIMRDPATDALVGQVWDMDANAQPPRPPEAIWVTAKGNKSYIYDLRHAAPEEAPLNV